MSRYEAASEERLNEMNPARIAMSPRNKVERARVFLFMHGVWVTLNIPNSPSISEPSLKNLGH